MWQTCGPPGIYSDNLLFRHLIFSYYDIIIVIIKTWLQTDLTNKWKTNKLGNLCSTRNLLTLGGIQRGDLKNKWVTLIINKLEQKIRTMDTRVCDDSRNDRWRMSECLHVAGKKMYQHVILVPAVPMLLA